MRWDVIQGGMDPLELREIRLAAHRSLADVARNVGTAPSNLARWERGKAMPRFDAGMRWLAAIEEMLADRPVEMEI
jgi:transcriptional regulator with XRE-family HTH domain